MARTETACSPAVRSTDALHCTQARDDRGSVSAHGIQTPQSTDTSTAATPLRGAQATPATSTGPTATVRPDRGTSIRDCVLIGASLAQPPGTQSASTPPQVISSISDS